MLQDCVNEPLTLVRRRIRQECTHLFRRGQEANGIQLGPPEKFRIGTKIGRHQPQTLELRQSQAIDKIVGGNGRIGLGLEHLVGRHHQRGCSHQPHIAGHHHTLPRQLADGHPTGLIHASQLLVARIVGGQPRDIANTSIGIACFDLQSLLSALAIPPLSRKHRNRLQHGLIGQRIGHARANPAS